VIAEKPRLEADVRHALRSSLSLVETLKARPLVPCCACAVSLLTLLEAMCSYDVKQHYRSSKSLPYLGNTGADIPTPQLPLLLAAPSTLFRPIIL
jgi:hypothetical protein